MLIDKENMDVNKAGFKKHYTQKIHYFCKKVYKNVYEENKCLPICLFGLKNTWNLFW